MFFVKLEDILFQNNPTEKISKFKNFYDEFKYGNLEFEKNFKPKTLVTPSYASFCDVKSMREMKIKYPKEKNFAAFVHSIAHIEYSAIDIALDAAYRFANLPCEYYLDWLEVADDEIRHFEMICEYLQTLGYKYSDFAVHDGLFIAMQKTENSFLNRMALLPRYMEANGLDANMHMESKISKNSDKKLTNILSIILDEEISHVKKGDKWFKFACKQNNLNPDIYINIVKSLYPNAFKQKRELNINARLKAGFSKFEIEQIMNLMEQK
ncbi:ferritin-like domain-containing protein [Campylobacter sp. RM12327]|uniref:ferritin-like domain-containing protein n=1 Tax=Campylobacter sputorum TaxID=206 RepID=UPI000B78D72D|nr:MULTISPECIES: ferritin-like domain-containing protein [Campylobacter]ASM40268.1 DUF455 domain protein [Campylobacter sputorum]MBE7357464.1 ferritin-like domain-containing protein [Campylobacter sp. RM11302]MBF6668774.1 ferritin-like domain-containing protein [Campylobacter sp. RM12327]MBF6674680.1 ferritin-like domain-containing protein [Campylobacter sp. RM13538]MBF6676003.1 ferritin-like domain-containing protein [Campylobacter sp. RM12321]